MNWRALVTARPGYAIQSHNRWFSNWVAYRSQASKNAANLRVIRIASKRVVFEVEHEQHDAGRDRQTYRKVLALALLAATMIPNTIFVTNLAMTPESANVGEAADPIKQPACVDPLAVHSFETVESAELFEVQGWRFDARSRVVSLGQLVSGDYSATCGVQTRGMRVLLIRQGDVWQVEKMAPTK